jgi:undecaprenyl-diphosphatase
MSAMAFYGFLIYLCVRYEVKKPLRILIVTVLALLILSIGLSRIYLGVHFPSDVAAGFVGGFIWVMFCAIIFNVFELWQMKNRSKKQNGSTPEK